MSTTTTSGHERDTYLHHVSDLYQHVRRWVAGFDPNAVLEEEEVTIHEEPVDPYIAKVLVIKRPNYKTVRMIPRGRWIIGAEGRVDLESDYGTETLLYAPDGVILSLLEITEGGKILEGRGHPQDWDVAEGWVFMQNRETGLMPSLDAELMHRLLEVLGR